MGVRSLEGVGAKGGISESAAKWEWRKFWPRVRLVTKTDDTLSKFMHARSNLHHDPSCDHIIKMKSPLVRKSKINKSSDGLKVRFRISIASGG